MSISPNHSARHGFSLIELLATISIIALMAALLLPALQGAKGKAQRTRCGNNLRQIGIAFHSWAHDHEDKFPSEVSTNFRGTLEFAQTGESMFAFKHFQALSNELVETRLLICPVDLRSPALDFAALQNSNVSYLVNSRPIFGNPHSVLAADRNIRTSGRMEYTYMQFGPGDVTEWSAGLHGARGNVLFGDAHVDAVDARELSKSLGAGGDVVLIVPQPDSTIPASGSGVAAPPGQSVPEVAGNTTTPNDWSSPAAVTPPATLSPAQSGTAFPVSLGSNTAASTGNSAGSPASTENTSAPRAVGSSSDFIARSGSQGGGASAIETLVENMTTTQQLAVTSAPSVTRLGTNSGPAMAATPPDRDHEELNIGMAKWLGKAGTRATYGLLVLLLAIFLAIEIARRRRKKKKEQEA